MHLFNTTGYRAVFEYFIVQSENQIVEQLDKEQYNNDELIEIKFPLHLPYMLNSDYARVDGNVEFEGVHYNYVKRKVENDTLYLLCLPNKQKTKLNEARNKYTEQMADTAFGNKKNPDAKKIQPITEYSRSVLVFNFHNPVRPMETISARYTADLINSRYSDFFQPPEIHLS